MRNLHFIIRMMGSTISLLAAPSPQKVVVEPLESEDTNGMIGSVAKVEEVVRPTSNDPMYKVWNINPEILSSIRLINFQDFVSLGTFPRYPENKDLTICLTQLTEEPYKKSLIVFVSHCWLRGWDGAEGWDGRPHPDNATGDKYTLCVEGIKMVMKHLCPGMEECYIWLDYGCIDQDGNPAGELKLLDKIVQISDCIFTPIYDKDASSWKFPKTIDDYFEDYKSVAWTGSPYSYVNRGWCRVEMFYAANIPLFEQNDERKSKFAAGFAFQQREGRRPHILYGSKEVLNNVSPIILPPLQNSYFEHYHPVKGHLTQTADQAIIESLVLQLKPYMKNITAGYVGEYSEHNKKHGKGKYTYTDGSIYEGNWKDDEMSGHGIFKFASGAVYEGEYQNGVMWGRGIYKFANGDVYEGDFKVGESCGYGIFKQANGNVYEGEWKDNVKNGRGIFKYTDGSSYEGEYNNDLMCGHGIFKFANGDIFEGEWKDDVMCGHGVYTYEDGDVFEGE